MKETTIFGSLWTAFDNLFIELIFAGSFDANTVAEF